MISGLETVSSGSIFIGDEDVTHLDPSQRDLTMVFQTYALYPHLSVYDNIGFGMKHTGVPKDEIDQKVRLAAKTLQLDNLLDRKPSQLSGGQRQRVAIGRSLVRNPRLFLFDEPLSNLDAELRVEMRLQIAKLHEELKTTMIYVTHDQVEAMTLADKIVVLKEGQIEQVGSPLEIYKKPVNEFVACFIGSPAMNLIPAVVDAVSGGEVTIRLPDGQTLTLTTTQGQLTANDRVKFGIRPEHLSVRSKGTASLMFTNEVSERLGSSTYLFGQIAGVDNMKVHVSRDVEFSKFENIELHFDIENAHLFDSAGLCITS